MSARVEGLTAIADAVALKVRESCAGVQRGTVPPDVLVIAHLLVRLNNHAITAAASAALMGDAWVWATFQAALCEAQDNPGALGHDEAFAEAEAELWENLRRCGQ